jgi:farnesyl-diphosphate farnesyltransferase
MQKPFFPESTNGDNRSLVSPLSPTQDPQTLLGLTRKWLPKVSRSFAPSIALLEEPMEGPVGLAYLCCRILDTLEDSLLPVQEKRTLLSECMAVFHGQLPPEPLLHRLRDTRAFEGESDADGALLLNLEPVLREVYLLPQSTRNILLHCMDEMGEGMMDMMEISELRNEAELHRYCHIVAGTVGNFLTDLYLQQPIAIEPEERKTLEAQSENFAQGLQRVNIAADAGKDLIRKITFIPGLLKNKTPSLERHLDFCKDTLRYLDGGLEYLLAVCPKSAYRSFCALPLLLAGKTLSRVAGHPGVFSSEGAPRVPREETMKLIVFCRDSVQSDQAIQKAFADFTAPLRTMA